MPTYLRLHPCTQESWKQHASRIRELCTQAIEVRRTNRKYIVWLKDMLRQYFRNSSNLQVAG
jgi:hypothetical protein